MLGFAAMMIAAALAMLNGRSRTPRAPGRTPVLRIVVDGLLVGFVTGMVGAGGGFLVVPALALLAGLPMSAAVGTSLLVIAMKSFTGLAGHLTSTTLDWGPVLLITAVTVVGALLGARIAGRLPEQTLKTGFGLLVLIMGLVVVSLELPSPYGMVVAALLGLALSLHLCRRSLTCPRRSRAQVSHTAGAES